MSQGIISQSMSIFCKGDVSQQDIAKALAAFQPRIVEAASESWEFSGPSLVLPFENEKDKSVVVDVVKHAWPDDMGFENQESILYRAWDEGQFGPCAFAGSLERAAEQSWVWPDGRSVSDRYDGFIRVRVVFADDDPSISIDRNAAEEYDPIHELAFLTRICSALLELPQAICFFNPNGEVLRDRESFRESESLSQEHGIPSIDLWSNVRLFRFDNDWMMMDTIGNSQLGLPDIEACFDANSYALNSVDQLLRTITMYMVENEELELEEGIEDEDSVSWSMHMHDDSLCDPPRPVLRLVPDDGREIPEEIVNADG